jgi:hypothetical protein
MQFGRDKPKAREWKDWLLKDKKSNTNKEDWSKYIEIRKKRKSAPTAKEIDCIIKDLEQDGGIGVSVFFTNLNYHPVTKIPSQVLRNIGKRLPHVGGAQK